MRDFVVELGGVSSNRLATNYKDDAETHATQTLNWSGIPETDFEPRHS